MRRFALPLGGLAALVAGVAFASFASATKAETRWVLAEGSRLVWRAALAALVFALSLTPAGFLVGSNDEQETSGPSLPTYSLDGELLAFTSDRSGRNELYVARTGAAAHRITDSEHGVGAPAWSPDGSRIVFSAQSGKEWPDRELSGLFVIDRDGSGLRQLTRGEDYSACWAADGKTIVFERGLVSQELRAIDPDGANGRRLLRYASTPACSPTESRIAFETGGAGIGVLDLDSMKWRTVVQMNEAVEVSSPTWSRNGRTIAFEVWRPREASDPEISSWVLQWYFTDLYRIAADSTDLTRLTDNTVGDRWPYWLPDGRIVFISNRAGPDDLTNSDASEYYVMNADGSGVERFPWDPRYS